MRYRILLLDADNTLMDFDAAQRCALKEMLGKYGYAYHEEVLQRYDVINHELWEAFNRGLIEKDYLLEKRFSRLFAELEFGDEQESRADAAAFNKEYVSCLGNYPILLDGALAFCREMSRECELYIVTNGVSITQKKRFLHSPIKEYIKEIFISEEIGFQKPRREFFEYVESRIAGFAKEDALVIGDSLSSDILGANNAGIKACWYNPHGLFNNTEAVCDYTVGDFEQMRMVIRRG